MNDLEKVLEEVTGFVTYHGDRVFQHWNQFDIAKMGEDNVDVTTNFDVEIEKAFADFVLEHFPEHGFLGEELHELNRDGEYVWHIDPLDGTKFFTSGVPLWGTTLALVKDRDPVLGIVYNPTTKQLYRAIKGKGAWLNDSKLSADPGTDTDKIQLAFDLTTRKFDWENLQHRLADIQSEFMKRFYRVRMLGNGAYALAWAAQGMFGVYVDPYRHKDKYVDIAAGILIATEAGLSARRVDLGAGLEQIIVAPEPLLDTIQQIMKLDHED